MSQTVLQNAIWQTVAMIPKGRVTNYGEIAKRCGYPGYARFVGYTLKNLPGDSTLPWHRVVKANGVLAFPLGSPKFEQQKGLLEAEGVIVTEDKVKMRQYFWDE